MDTARNFKANIKLDGKPCGWCKNAMAIGMDVSVCTACDQAHHANCWTSKSGCGTVGCRNAPLPELAPLPKAASGLPPGFMHCPSCNATLLIGSQFCSVCRAITSPDGIYHGPKVNAPGAVASMVYGIVGLFICGLILGIVAISKASSAKAAMRLDPTLGGGGYATSGTVLGIIAIVCWALILLLRLSAQG